MATNTQVDKKYGAYDLQKKKEQVKQAIDHAYNQSLHDKVRLEDLDSQVTDVIDQKTTEAEVNALIEAWGATHGGDSFYGVCNTSSSVTAKTVQIDGFTSDNLTSGTRVTVKFNASNSIANATLNVSTTGDLPIKYYGVASTAANILSGAWGGGQIVDFIFYGGSGLNGCWVMLDGSVGSQDWYGNLKLSNATDSTLGTNDGTAATPAAVKAAYDKAVEAASGIPFAEGSFVNGTMSLTIPGITELIDKQVIRVRFTSNVVPYSTGLKLSMNGGTAYSIMLSNQDLITTDNYGMNVLWHLGSSIVLIYNLTNTCWMVDTSEYADRCNTAERASAINSNAITLSGNDIKQIDHNGTKRNLMATDYDISNGTIKAKFDEIELDVGDLKMIQKRDNSTAVCTNNGDNRTISTPTEWGSILPLQDGQRLTVRFDHSIFALSSSSGNIAFTIQGESVGHPFCPNGIDPCTTSEYPANTPIIAAGTLTTIEFHTNTEYPNGCWQLTDRGFCETARQAERVGVDFDEAKLLKMDSLIDYAKYYDGRALTPTDQSQFEWSIDSYHKAHILSYIGSATDVVVPPFYYNNGTAYPVTVIDNVTDGNVITGAFDSTDVETVVLPNTITNLAFNAFYNCQDLESVNIPSSMETIDTSAFKDCSSLEEIIIDTKDVVVGNSAFLGCSNLTVYCYQGSQAETVAAADNISVEYLDDVISYGSSDDDDVTIDVKNGKEYRCLNNDASTPLTTLTVNLPTMDTTTTTDIKTEFDSLVTFYCGSSSFQFSGAYPSTGTQFIQYFGKDCDDGVFLPSEQGYVYNLAYWWNGKMYVCTVV